MSAATGPLCGSPSSSTSSACTPIRPSPRFEKAVAGQRAEDARIDVTFLPFQVYPAAPEHGEPVRERHRRDFRANAGQLADRMTTAAALDGLTLDFGRAVFVNTFRAHHLLATAPDRSPHWPPKPVSSPPRPAATARASTRSPPGWRPPRTGRVVAPPTRTDRNLESKELP
jgi:hypothetical protein